jgi:hypothetical protein
MAEKDPARCDAAILGHGLASGVAGAIGGAAFGPIGAAIGGGLGALGNAVGQWGSANACSEKEEPKKNQTQRLTALLGEAAFTSGCILVALSEARFSKLRRVGATAAGIGLGAELLIGFRELTRRLD